MKATLLKKLVNCDSGRYIFFPLDFGFYKSPTAKLKNIPLLIDFLCKNKIGIPMMHKGLVKTFQKQMKESGLPFFMHITGSTGLFPTIEKVQVAGVKEAKELGAIGVSTLIYLGNPYELEMIEMLARISDSADKNGLLLYTMIYVANYENDQYKEDLRAESIKYAARVAYEIGVDIVETRLPTDTENFSQIKELCPLPLIFGDRSSYSDEKYIEKTILAIRNGYDGISISERSLENDLDTFYKNTLKGFSNLIEEEKLI